MSRFGDLVGGKKSAPAPAAPAAPAPVAAPTPPAEAVAPDLGEDTTKYYEAIEEEIAEESYESDVSLQDMSKKELEEYGRTVGIELDRRHSHSRLVKELKAYLEDNS